MTIHGGFFVPSRETNGYVLARSLQLKVTGKRRAKEIEKPGRVRRLSQLYGSYRCELTLHNNVLRLTELGTGSLSPFWWYIQSENSHSQGGRAQGGRARVNSGFVNYWRPRLMCCRRFVAIMLGPRTAPATALCGVEYSVWALFLDGFN